MMIEDIKKDFHKSLKELQESTAKELQALKEKQENTAKQVEIIKEKQENTSKQLMEMNKTGTATCSSSMRRSPTRANAWNTCSKAATF